MNGSVLQPWVEKLPLMQQGVLIGGMRGPDGIPKYDGSKYLLRWYRRSCLRLALPGKDGKRIKSDPISPGGGSYQGPSIFGPPDPRPWEEQMVPIVDNFIKSLDGLPHHFVQHLRHGIQVLGYKHPDSRIRIWWNDLYVRLVNDEHLHIETVAEMDERLGDNYANWRKRSDDATAA